MDVPRYELYTDWTLNAPLERVWEELSHPERWPTWWKGVKAVELLEPGDSNGIGANRRMTWRSLLPYDLTFNMRTVRLEPMRLIEGIAEGELEGRGLWTLSPLGAGTKVRYEWRVDATKAWMRLLAPIAKPLFSWNHGVIMGWGATGLELRLSVLGSGLISSAAPAPLPPRTAHSSEPDPRR